MDKSSTTLRQYCGLGTAINSATISCNKQAGDKKVEYLKVTMHNVVITSIQEAVPAAAPIQLWSCFR